MSVINFLKSLFKVHEIKSPDPISGLLLSTLKKGYCVDYDLKSWLVTAKNHYDWGDGDITYEWQLKSADDTIYLERDPDDEDVWTVSKKINFASVDPTIKERFATHEDPPEKIVFENNTYYLEETGAGKFYSDKNMTGLPLIKWDFADDFGINFISIEQWGEHEFEASTGIKVEEYEFDNILPSANQLE
ncbi:MAG: DUF4178 domain-containing protein [Desulfobacterales bacterium]|nr:DUF4178 domain-containing protein [Desulfobacterales bacterium]